MDFMNIFRESIADGHRKADSALDELRTQTDHLATIMENTREQEFSDQTRRVPVAQVPVVGGSAQATIDAPQGIAWNLMSIAGDSAVTAAGVEVRIYLNTNDPWNLIKVIRPTDTGRWSADFPADEYVPQGGRLVIEWVGQGAQVVVNASVKVQNLIQRPE